MTTKHSVTVLASAQRTASENSADQNGNGARGIHLVLDITVDAGGALDVKLQRKDPLSGKHGGPTVFGCLERSEVYR